jgi:uncharacterized protein (DUF305 family)
MKKPVSVILFLMFSTAMTYSHRSHKQGRYPKKAESNADTSLNLFSVPDKMIRQLNQLNLTGNMDDDIAMVMIVRHLGAIDLNMVEFQTGKNEVLKRLARKMIHTEMQEILALNKVLISSSVFKRDYDPANITEGLGLAMTFIFKQVAAINHGSNDTVDDQFAAMMILHDRVGVKIDKVVLRYGKGEALKIIAKQMVKGQRADSKALRQWLHVNHYSSRPDTARPGNPQ